MNWINTFSQVTTVVLAGDLASFLVASLIFSERVRGFVRRLRSDQTTSAPEPATVAPFVGDTLSLRASRSRALVRNPFDPSLREGMDDFSARKRNAHSSRRPTFRRSVVLQQRVARYERKLGSREISLDQNDGAGDKGLQLRFRLLDQSF